MRWRSIALLTVGLAVSGLARGGELQADAAGLSPDRAARTADALRPLAATDDGAAFDLMLLLHGALPKTPDSRAELRALIRETVNRIAGYRREPGPSIPQPDPDDTTVHGFVAVLRYVGFHGNGVPRPGASVPCEMLRRNPGYAALADPWFGSTADNQLPAFDCAKDDLRLPPASEAYFEKLAGRLEAVVGPDAGTSRYGWYRRDAADRLRIRVAPQALLTLPAAPGHEPRPTHRPLETWSMMSLANRLKFDEYAALYEPALPELARHYRTRFGLGAADALAAARIAMLLPAHEGHWAAPDRGGLRRLILDGAPLADIAAVIDSAPARDAVPMTLLGMASHEGAWLQVGTPDPLISVSVHRPDVLRLLLDRGPLAQPFVEGLHRGDQTVDPNARTWTGKTPLMTAAEVDRLESVRILLDAGADPNAALDAPELRHDRRTALHYAAAKASGPVIEALLAGAADPTAVDSQGFGIIDYLQGRGPTGPNPNLTSADVRRISGHLPPSRHSGDRRSALMLAAAEAGARQIDDLLDAGADPTLTDAAGATAADYLRRRPDDGSVPDLRPDVLVRLSRRMGVQ